MQISSSSKHPSRTFYTLCCFLYTQPQCYSELQMQGASTIIIPMLSLLIVETKRVRAMVGTCHSEQRPGTCVNRGLVLCLSCSLLSLEMQLHLDSWMFGMFSAHLGFEMQAPRPYFGVWLTYHICWFALPLLSLCVWLDLFNSRCLRLLKIMR